MRLLETYKNKVLVLVLFKSTLFGMTLMFVVTQVYAVSRGDCLGGICYEIVSTKGHRVNARWVNNNPTCKIARVYKEENGQGGAVGKVKIEGNSTKNFSFVGRPYVSTTMRIKNVKDCAKPKAAKRQERSSDSTRAQQPSTTSSSPGGRGRRVTKEYPRPSQGVCKPKGIDRHGRQFPSTLSHLPELYCCTNNRIQGPWKMREDSRLGGECSLFSDRYGPSEKGWICDC